ncbi:MAG: Clp protease/crotonase-like domain-containing protein, partial [Planctomycetota bacterium]
MRHGLRNTVVGSILLSIATVAFAGQAVELRLKDGSRWRGELSEYVELTILQNGVEVPVTGRLIKAAEWFLTIETDVAGELRNKTIFKNDILKIRTLGSDDAGASLDLPRRRPDTTGRAKEAGAVIDPDQPGVIVLPLKKMVGVEFRHEEMEKVAEEADKYGPGQIIVLLIDSGGGSVVEMETIHKTLMDIKQRHRLVAWIKQAISAACATAMHCDEIYFMTEGTAGAMTAFNSATGQAWKGKELKEWMRRAGDWMEQGGRSRYIAEAMIHAPRELSYDKDPDTGKVTFYNDLSGEVILSDAEHNLVFNASLALDCGFSDGTADTEEDLAKLLDLPAWHEKTDFGREISEKWVDMVEMAQRECRRLNAQLTYLGTGSGDQVEIIGKRIKIFEKMIQWQDRAPNAVRGMVPPKEQLKREIKDLRKQLA